jgi:AraC family transcriptional regulator, regulatory protein of adaptative response / methylated-DNA-[protein]-cysteine methyltransferase
MMTAALTTIRRTPPPSAAEDPRWARIAARDKTADGHFWYSVSTTRVYCRASCPSRIANPTNVQLHDTLESARATGFRPCKRCKPEGAAIEQMAPVAADEEIRFAVAQTSLGALVVASSATGIASILLGDDPTALVRNLQDRFPHARLIGGDRDYETLVARVVGFVESPEIRFDLPLDMRGTDFQRRVWLTLQAIPVGKKVTYAEIARRIGAPKAVRAVAGACAANHLAIAIPCHRVVRTDGSLSGYAWGIERKRTLLDREAATVRLKPDATSVTVRLKPDATSVTVRLKPDATSVTVRLKPDTTYDAGR